MYAQKQNMGLVISRKNSLYAILASVLLKVAVLPVPKYATMATKFAIQVLVHRVFAIADYLDIPNARYLERPVLHRLLSPVVPSYLDQELINTLCKRLLPKKLPGI
jgi:hypothetical protein